MTQVIDSTPAQPPAPIVTTDLWNLRADPGHVAATADAWLAVAATVRDAHWTVETPAANLTEATWSGTAADTYRAHLHRLGNSAADTAAAAEAVGGALDRMAGALHSGQGMLDHALRSVSMSMDVQRSGGTVTFHPRADNQTPLVSAAISAAHDIRQHLDETLLDAVAAIEKARPDLAAVAAAWLAVAQGASDGWQVPPDPSGTEVVYAGNEVIVSTGSGNDTVTVGVDPATGLTVVTVNGRKYYVAAGQHVTVRTGAGDDTIEVAAGTTVGFTLLGGTGDDTITGGAGTDVVLGLSGRDRLYGKGGADRVSGGAQRDYIDGGTGDDTLAGGLGEDTVYGLDGNDQISGGEGQDYLEGGAGNDTVDGGTGNDILSGGRGDDTLRGGAGNDVMYAGLGKDSSDGGAGTDTAYGEAGDGTAGVERGITVQIKDLGSFIKVEGSPDFVARVQADLDMLRSSPDGQQMLAALDQGHRDSESGMLWWHKDGDSLTIREYNNPSDPNNSTAGHGDRTNDINYNVHLDQLTMATGVAVEGPPVAVLYHEMAHVYDYMNDTLAPGTYPGPVDAGINNLEREAAGLPIDEDGDPSTPEQFYSKHPFALTENGLREEMGAPHRDAY